MNIFKFMLSPTEETRLGNNIIGVMLDDSKDTREYFYSFWVIEAPPPPPVTCEDDEYLDVDGQTCKPCGSNGATYLVGDKCESCPDDSQLNSDNTSCTCNDKFYMDGQKCKPCSSTCATCSSGNKCKTCPAGFDLGDKLCLKCGDNEVIDGDACVPDPEVPPGPE